MATVGHNSTLSPGEKRALAYDGLRRYDKAMAIKKKADADFKNECKKIIAQGTTIERIKQLKSFQEDPGGDRLRAEVEALLEIASWTNSPVGTQFSLLDEPDRQPVEEKAYQDGKIAGYLGETARTPEGYTGPVEQAWLRGNADGQQELMAALELTKEGIDLSEGAKRQKGAAAPAEGGNVVAMPKRRGRPPKAKADGAQAAAPKAKGKGGRRQKPESDAGMSYSEQLAKANASADAKIADEAKKRAPAAE